MAYITSETLFTLFALFNSFSPTGASSTFSPFKPRIPPAEVVQKAENISTKNPGRCLTETKFFPQAVDHATFTGDYNTANATFFHQYEINDTFYKPGGPIIFLQGGETSVFSCIEYGIAPEWAKEMNGLMVAIEHRYFGLSCPYGLNYSEFSTWDPSLFKPLSFQNALFDGLTLLNWIKTVAYPDTKDAKVIIDGGMLLGLSLDIA